MPLQLTFHLELARPSTITTVWDPVEERLRVIAISGGGRLIEELKKHAEEAGLRLAPLNHEPVTSAGDEQLWQLLKAYSDFSERLQLVFGTAFSDIFSHLQVEQSSKVGTHRAWGEIRLFMKKPGGGNTKAWVWKDNLLWIEAKQ